MNFAPVKKAEEKFTRRADLPVVRIALDHPREIVVTSCSLSLVVVLSLNAATTPKGCKTDACTTTHLRYLCREVDFLIRRHASFNLLSSATTLGSLSRLVQSLPSMIIMDEIGARVKLSLEASTSAQSIAAQGAYDAVALSSRQARALAEDAFFHHSIMSLLYFPIEHHIAIYMPFFVPVLMHVFLATFREVKRYRRERFKFLNSKIKQQ